MAHASQGGCLRIGWDAPGTPSTRAESWACVGVPALIQSTPRGLQYAELRQVTLLDG
jgi:hypothetical protein